MIITETDKFRVSNIPRFLGFPKYAKKGSLCQNSCAITFCYFRLCHHASANEGKKLRPAPSQMQSLMDIGSREIFDTEHDAFRETARKFFQKEVAPKMAE